MDGVAHWRRAIGVLEPGCDERSSARTAALEKSMSAPLSRLDAALARMSSATPACSKSGTDYNRRLRSIFGGTLPDRAVGASASCPRSPTTNACVEETNPGRLCTSPSVSTRFLEAGAVPSPSKPLPSPLKKKTPRGYRSSSDSPSDRTVHRSLSDLEDSERHSATPSSTKSRTPSASTLEVSMSTASVAPSAFDVSIVDGTTLSTDGGEGQSSEETCGLPDDLQNLLDDDVKPPPTPRPLPAHPSSSQLLKYLRTYFPNLEADIFLSTAVAHDEKMGHMAQLLMAEYSGRVRAEARVEELQSKVDALTSANAALAKGKNLDECARCLDLQLEVALAHDDAETARTQLEANSREASSAEAVKALREENDQLRQFIADANMHAPSDIPGGGSEEEVLRLGAELAETKQELCKVQEDLARVESEASSQVRALATELDEALERRQQVEDEMDNLLEERDTVAAALDEAVETQEAMSELLDETSADLHSHRGLLERHEIALKEAEDKNERLADELLRTQHTLPGHLLTVLDSHNLVAKYGEDSEAALRLEERLHEALADRNNLKEQLATATAIISRCVEEAAAQGHSSGGSKASAPGKENIRGDRLPVAAKRARYRAGGAHTRRRMSSGPRRASCGGVGASHVAVMTRARSTAAPGKLAR